MYSFGYFCRAAIFALLWCVCFFIVLLFKVRMAEGIFGTAGAPVLIVPWEASNVCNPRGKHFWGIVVRGMTEA